MIEIVSEPDMHSAAEAKAYAAELYRLMTYAGVTHGDLYHGNMRFDVNISVAKKGASELGKRAEVKNLNSFRSVERAAEYEFKRQIDLLESGQTVSQETRGWDDDKQIVEGHFWCQVDRKRPRVEVLVARASEPLVAVAP